MKDLNLISCKTVRVRNKKSGLLQFDHKKDIRNIKKQIKADSEFLQSLGFLDYSLLLAVEKIKNP